MSDFAVKPIDVTAEKLEAIGKMNINDVAVDENSDNSSFPTSKVVNEAIKGGTANLLPLDVETEWIFDGGTAETEIEPKFVIDNEPSTTSPNAVKNNAITKYVNSKVKIVSDKTNELEEKYENLQIAPAIESGEYPGCYYRMVDDAVEWINPPMNIYEEYRTTERFQGHVVYRQLLRITSDDINELLNEGQLNITGLLSGVLILRFHAWTDSFVLPYQRINPSGVTTFRRMSANRSGGFFYEQTIGLDKPTDIWIEAWYYKK